MPDFVIRSMGLGKRYQLGQTLSHDTLRDSLTHWGRRLTLRRGGSTAEGEHSKRDNEFWALQDVSFTVAESEVVGVIGRNGAGKSTLLKILSQITDPTEGEVLIRGRVASLLEVGTGFHPELTGRENIYLNGAILGMTRQEIKTSFDEIVAFSGVERFIDTPVKRYSSGMYVRLAFAVAAHLEPEILLVDEVLAVGDMAFQKKCLGKMEDVAKGGRTVLFVSHNMGVILSLCNRAILLENGRIQMEGRTVDVVEEYIAVVGAVAGKDLGERLDRKGNGRLRFESSALRAENGAVSGRARSGQTVELAFRYTTQSQRPLRNVHIAVGIHGSLDEMLCNLSTATSADFASIPGSGEIRCRIPKLPLMPGRYYFNLYSTVDGEISDWIRNAGMIEVEPGDFYATGRLPPPNQGPFLVEHSWHLD